MEEAALGGCDLTYFPKSCLVLLQVPKFFVPDQKFIYVYVTTIGHHIEFFLEFYTYKNLRIEPFNYAIKSVCFDF